MSEDTRSELYQELFPSQTRERFEADAREAALHGWRPRYQHWSGTFLRVTYVRQATPVTRERVGQSRRSMMRSFR
jgi:hypothetical protein